ncbi:hypothetical protein KY290_008018 [Solanum tuberosum]|uniref:Uncharacterized protein n=1 Tax=Solanum tuberosum TaxID=4113 RepID=A0ABQ7W796_SOLTU|nr:hypothetical protein KY290_008018 [Solanum tuberosum]
MFADTEEQSLCMTVALPSNNVYNAHHKVTPLPDLIEWNVPEYIKDDIVRPPNFKRLSESPPKKLRDKA